VEKNKGGANQKEESGGVMKDKEESSCHAPLGKNPKTFPYGGRGKNGGKATEREIGR